MKTKKIIKLLKNEIAFHSKKAEFNFKQAGGNGVENIYFRAYTRHYAILKELQYLLEKIKDN